MSKFKAITFLFIIVFVIFIIFVFNSQPNQSLKPEDLNLLKIKAVGTSVSEGVTSEKYAFKTKDNGIIQIGTERHSPPKPYVMLDKWDGEVSLKIRMPFETGDNPTVVGDKLRYSTADKPVSITPWQKLIPLSFAQTATSSSKVDIDIYPKPVDKQNENGGVEFDTVFYAKPAINKIVFPIETANLDFFYQPALNEENKDPKLTCTETECRDKDGHVVNSRSENVVGSYAVYDSSHPVNYVGGKDYKTGKVFQIYRPKITDAKGSSIWGTLNVDKKNNTLTITVDQSWLDNAAYPVTVDPTFGYTSTGATVQGCDQTYIYATIPYTGSGGTAYSISFYGYAYTSPNVQMAIYTDNGSWGATKVANTSSKAITMSAPSQWWTQNLTSNAAITAQSYRIAYANSVTAQTGFYYDSSSAVDTGLIGSQTFGTWPASLTWTDSGNKYIISIFVTYTGGAIAPSLQSGLVGWWKFDGNAKDSSPYSNNGTDYGAILTTDRKGQANKAYSFNGSSNYIDAGNGVSLQITGPITLAGWVKLNNLAADQFLFGRGHPWGSSGDYGYTVAFYNSSKTIYFDTYSPTRDALYTNNNAITDNNWHHIVATWDGTTNANGKKIYIDGNIAVQAASSISSMGAPTVDFSIGKDIIGGNYYLNGSVDDVRVYNRALSQAEVADLYNSYDQGIVISSLQSGLVGWWKLAGNAKDSTPNGNDGTATGTSLTTDRKGQPYKAFNFDGSSQYITVAPIQALMGSNDYTIAAWINTTKTSNTGNIFTNVVNGSYEIKCQTYNGNLRLGAHISGGELDTTGNINVADGKWHHIACVKSGNTGYVYVDGALDVSSATQAVTGTAAYATIGVEQYGASSFDSYFLGLIDDVRVYGRALSVGEIKDIYDSYDSGLVVSDLQKGLVGQWDFSGNTKDSTPYSNNGTNYGASLTTDRKGQTNKAYSFNGTSNYIDAGNSSSLDFSLTNMMTVAGWIKFSDLDYSGSTGKLHFIATKGYPDNGTPNAGWWFAYDNRTNQASFAYTCFGNSGGGYCTGANTNDFEGYNYTFTNGVWYHVAFTVSQDSIAKLYVNGVQLGSDLSLSNLVLSDATRNMAIGNFPAGCGSSCSGFSLDNVRVYNRELSADEIKALYDSY